MNKSQHDSSSEPVFIDTNKKTGLYPVWLSIALVYLIIGLGTWIGASSFNTAVVWFALAGTFFAVAASTKSGGDGEMDADGGDD